MVAKTFSYKMTLFLSTILLMAFLTGCAASGQADLTGVTWRWTSLEETEPASISVVPNPDNFTLTFDGENGLGMRLDCNTGGGSYALSGSDLTIQMGITTLAYCGEESLDMLFSQLLSEVDSYALEDGQLILFFGEGAGKMIFTQ